MNYLSWPLTIIPTLEHNASASSIECVVNIAPLDPWKLLIIASHKYLLDLGSIPVLGSSSNTSLGFPIIAKAKLNFRFVPPEQQLTCLSACSVI